MTRSRALARTDQQLPLARQLRELLDYAQDRLGATIKDARPPDLHHSQVRQKRPNRLVIGRAEHRTALQRLRREP
jgi:hypothetical protein